jgi:hypothetical protein
MKLRQITYHSTCIRDTAHLYPSFFLFLPLLFMSMKASSMRFSIVSKKISIVSECLLSTAIDFKRAGLVSTGLQL